MKPAADDERPQVGGHPLAMDDLIAWCIVPFDSRKRTQEERIAMLGGDVTNTGSRAGDEVVQLYVRYPGSRVYRPLKQLRGFQRVALASGETRTVSLRLAAADLAYWDAARHAWTVEPGRVELAVGPSSADADLGLRRTVTVAR